MSETNLRKDIEGLLNKHNMESGSDTPDFILATYLMNCLWAFDIAVRNRESWYGRGENPRQIRDAELRVKLSDGGETSDNPNSDENDRE